MAKKKELTLEEKLEQALIPKEEQPYGVPGNWCWVRLKDITFRISDGSHNPPKNSGEGIPLLSATNIHDHIIDVDSATRWITDEDWIIENKRTQIERNDILLTIVASIGRTAVVRDEKFALQRSVAVIKPKINTEFLSYYFETPYIQTFMNTNAKGTAQKGFYLNALEKLYCCIPPLSEQQRIVDCIESMFSKLDEAKDIAQEVVDSFDNRRASILHKAFTGELTKQWREKNGVSLDSWEHRELCKTSIEIIDGDRGKNYPKKEEFSQNGYCVFLNAKNVTKDGFRFDSIECITKEKDEILRKGRLERGDIVLTTRGTIGNIALYDNDISFEHLRINSGMVIYRGGKEFYKPFIIWLYKSDIVLNQIENLRTGSAQPQLPIKVMNAIKLPIPCVEEQKKIIDLVDSIMQKEQQAKEAAETVLDQIDMMKKAILARAFRGELGTNIPTEESSIELLKSILV